MKKFYQFANLLSCRSGKFFTLIMLFSLCWGAGNVFGQSATWNLKTSNTPVICGSLTAAAPVAGSSVANVTSVNATSGYSGTGFPTGIGAANYSNTSTNYFQYAVTNNSAGTLTFTGVNISTYYTGLFSTYMYFAIRYSTDNFATSILLTNDNQINAGASNLTGTTNITVAAGATLRYRVYGYYTDFSSYRFGNTSFQVFAGPAAPAAFTATAISGTQINLNATANGAGNNVMLVYNTVNTFGIPNPGTSYIAGNAIPGGGTVLYVGAAGNPFFNHTGLIQGNTYYYQLYSVLPACNLYSSMLAANATTLCPTFNLNFSEGFNTSGPAVFPTCWRQQFVTGSSPITFQATSTPPATNPQEGTRFISWNAYNITSGNQTRLVSPRINTVGTSSVNARFYWFHDNSNFTTATYNTEGVQVQTSSDGVTWASGVFIPRVLAGKNGWTVYDLNIGGGNNPSLYFGLIFTSRFGNNCSLDNLLLYPTPTCRIPNSPLTASAVALTTATISWAAASIAPALGYDYYVSTSPVAPTSGTTPTGSTGPGVTTANLTGLTANTVYYFWVRSRCSVSDQSIWVGATSFETTSLYCTSTSTTPSTYFFNQVNFVGTLLDVSNTSGYSATGYQNFTGLTPKSRQAQGQGMNIYVQANFSVYMRAWVDWNGDAVFDAAEQVYTTNDIITSTTTFGFVIPLATPPGDYIIRIRGSGSGTTFGPCGNLGNGETEDYTFTVIPTCSAQITGVGDGETCGTGPVILTATATAGTTEYRWYAAETGGALLATTFSGIWTTPDLGVTTIYYVTAYNGCESLVRTPVTARVRPIPVLSFTPTNPVVCGEGAVLQLVVSGDTEEGILINEKFNSGLGTFTVNNIVLTPPVATADAQWQTKSNTYVPSNTTTWHPAISSGFGANNFAFTTSDLNPLGILGTGTRINTALVSPTVSSVGYTSLALNFDLFFSHYLPDGTNTIIDSVVVDVATDAGGTNWTTAAYYITDQGIGTRFLNKIVPLNAYINIATLKIRIRYQGNWTDGAAVDNIRLSGTKPLSTNFSWSPSGNGNLFTDASGSTPYTGGPVPNVYIRPTPAQLAAGTPLNFTVTATLSNGCFASAPVTVAIGPSQWTGTLSNSWLNPNNWCSKVVPTATTIVEIPAGTPNSPVITGAAFSGKITINTGATLTLTNAGTLTVPGLFDNKGTLSNNGRIVLNGTTAQTFPGATGTVTSMSILETSNAAGVTLNKALIILKELRPLSGNFSLANFDVTLRSQGANTAAVSAVGGSISYGTGRFIVERYINTGTAAGQHSKSWQFLAAPAIGQTIKQSWMEGAGPNANPNPGYGTQVTGITGTAGGFDATAIYPAMKTYAPASNTWVEVGSPNTTQINNSQGYMIFVRGDRSVINFSGANSAPLPTILRIRGTIVVGPVSSSTVTAGSFQSVANPYPSAVDFSTITRTGGVDPNFYLFDPTLVGSQGLGSYQTITAATGYRATPGNLATTSTIYNTTSNYKNIQSGSAFFVRATGSNGLLNFAEANKVTGSTLANRNEDRRPFSMLSTNIITVTGTGLKLNDGNRVVFDNDYRNKVDGYDAMKRTNDGENFAVLRNGVTLAVEARKRLDETDTIFYYMSGLRQGAYKMMFIPENLSGTGLTGELVDKYLNTRTEVSLSDTNYVDVALTADAGSFAADRFMLVFKKRFTTTPPIVASDAAAGGNIKIPLAEQAGSISIFPNPLAGRKLQVQFNHEKEGKYTLQLTDKYGQVVYNGTAQVKGTVVTRNVDLSPSLAAGVYHLKITGADGKTSIQQVILL